MDAILAISRIAIIATIVVTGILNSVFEGMCSIGLVEVLDRPNSCFRIFSLKILRLRRAAYKLELCGHRDSNLVRFSRGCVH